MKYAITLTLRPMMYRYTATEQFIKTGHQLREFLKSYNASVVAELTGENNVHYHGIIELSDLIHRDKFLNGFRGSLIWGRKDCTQLMDEQKWITYLQKDIKHTKEITKLYPILCDDFQLLERPIEKLGLIPIERPIGRPIEKLGLVPIEKKAEAVIKK